MINVYSKEQSNVVTKRLTIKVRKGPVSNSKVKDQRVYVMVSDERSCQKEYTCEIWKPSTNQSKVITKVKVFAETEWFHWVPVISGALNIF
jgi:hypothetical protein